LYSPRDSLWTETILLRCDYGDGTSYHPG
jgi:hypothetical protein